MADVAHNREESPAPASSRSNLGLVGWALAGALAGGALAFGFTASSGPPLLTRPGVPVARPPGAVRTWSSLEALKAGNIGPTVQLAAVPKGPGVIGIGSLSGLRGEVAIVHGTTWVAYALPNSAVRTERVVGGGETATFLATADVPAWQSQTFDSPVRFDALASELERRIVDAGLDTNAPVPLVIDGELTSIELNVVNGPAVAGTTPTDERLAETAIRASVPAAKGTLVGFFARRGGERLIHAGERLHLHVVLPGTGEVGHLDGVTVGSGAVLRLPRASG